jgi:hypothetical protein
MIRNSSFSSQRPLSLYFALFVPARLAFIIFTAMIVWFLSGNPNQSVRHHSSLNMAQNTNPEPQKNIVILGGSYGGVSTASISFKAQQQSLTTPIELSPSA